MRRDVEIQGAAAEEEIRSASFIYTDRKDNSDVSDQSSIFLFFFSIVEVVMEIPSKPTGPTVLSVSCILCYGCEPAVCKRGDVRVLFHELLNCCLFHIGAC